ncbi:MAG: GNAT family N-acetyltransferase, partial [Streptomycetaceae bacterium]|nr:GNAT family N-acetyltransferase [Streptomycetaceae bacterium]
MRDLALPGGYRARPVRPSDIPSLHALVEACERHLLGYAESDADKIRA